METVRTHRVIGPTLLGLWLLGAALIVLTPGYEAYRSKASEPSYPALGVALVLAFSALELGATWFILRPSSYLRSYLRSGFAILVLIPCALFSVVLTAHAPFFVVVHALWALTLTCFVAILFLVSLVSSLRRAFVQRRGTRAA